MRISFRYTTTKEFVNECKILSIILINVSRALVKLKGLTNHLKRPSFDLKVVFHTIVSSIVA